MTRYYAFLRGINVGGHKVVSMADLTRAFESLGLESVRTHIQSGNVVFETRRGARAVLMKQIGAALHDLIGSEVALFLRTAAELEALAAGDPFPAAHPQPDDRLYVTFLPAKPRAMPPLPLWSPQKDVEIIAARGADLFSLGHAYRDHYGFPNAFIEKQFGVPATTRNRKTIVKLLG